MGGGMLPDEPEEEKPTKKDKEKEESKKDLRGGTGAAGPLIQMPGQ
jgi:hypothetical protein